MKRNSTIRPALGFDDILLLPAETAIRPEDVSTRSFLTKKIELKIPLVSAGHDSVTESQMAIALARIGGIGIIHDNMPLGKQVEEVRRVKRAQGDVISNPITIAPEASIAEALDLMTTYKISGLPVVEQPSEKVVGIITGRDVRFFDDYSKSVSDLMSKDVVTARSGAAKDTLRQMMHQNRIEKIVIVDDAGKCAGIVTVKDMDHAAAYPHATRDAQGRLRVAAAVSAGKDGLDRATAMADAGLDVVVIDVAHAHNKDVASTVSKIRQLRSSDVQVVVGNVATADAARSLIDAGADAIKVGVGACGQSASRRLSGIGVPQFSAVLAVCEQCSLQGIPVWVEGGMRDSAAIVKALAAGASVVVLDSLFAGTDEAPGEIAFQEGRAYKVVNPMARAQHRPNSSVVVHDVFRFDEDGVDTSIPYRGAVDYTVQHLLNGIKMGFAYTGSNDVASLHSNAEFVSVK